MNILSVHNNIGEDTVFCGFTLDMNRYKFSKKEEMGSMYYESIIQILTKNSL